MHRHSDNVRASACACVCVCDYRTIFSMYVTVHNNFKVMLMTYATTSLDDKRQDAVDIRNRMKYFYDDIVVSHIVWYLYRYDNIYIIKSH